MHKYQVSSSTVLPIATDDIAGKTEGPADVDRDGSTSEPKSAIGQQTEARRIQSNGSAGFTFTPHAQSLQPIASSQSHEPTITQSQPNAEASVTHAALGDQSTGEGPSAATPAQQGPTTESCASAQQQKAPLQKSGDVRLRRATIEMGGNKAHVVRLQRKRSMSLQNTKAIELTKNYEQLVHEFNMLRPFTRTPDGLYPRDTKCVICRRARPSAVFFPCQHRCVCDDCIESHRISADRSKPSNWCACPVCMAEICLILAHSGKEEEKYWKWVMEVQPRLSTHFKQEFKETARRLEKGTTTASVTCDSDDVSKLQSSDKSASRRRHTWQQPGLQQSKKSASRSFRASGDSGKSTCSIL